MARMHQWVGLAALGFVLTGCVSQEKYNALKLDRDAVAEQLGQSQIQASAAEREAAAYRAQFGSLSENMTNKEAMIASLNAENLEAQRRYDEAMRQLQEAMNRPGGVSMLPEPLSNELQQFANQNPDLVDFDAARGVVKFKSDVTFATGSAELTDKAREAINRFSQILNSSNASGYELMVAGHTDDTRVVNPETIKKGHLNNWYLSAHRAISVNDALLSQGVRSNRLAVVGYADQRPISSNKAQNRRVEVLILPTTVRAAAAGGANGSAAKSAPRMNKDAPAAPERRPALNK